MIDLTDLPHMKGSDGEINRGPYRRARGWRRKVTEAEVKAAVKRFEVSGGIIIMLPPEIVPPHNMVGWIHGAYEPIIGGNTDE